MALGRQFWKYQQMPTEQMKMFMSAREIRSSHKPLQGDFEEVDDWMDGMSADEDDATRMETEDELWNRKTEEAEDSGLYEDIEERGVQKPVHLSAYTADDRHYQGGGHERILGGHHRIAVMGETRPDDLMPVLHHRNLFDAQGVDSGHTLHDQRGRPYPYS
jgi:hypothetical protein